MNKIITGFILAIPLAMTSLPRPASALQVIIRPQVQKHESTLISRNRHQVRVPGHWEHRGHRKVWVPAHYEWRD